MTADLSRERRRKAISTLKANRDRVDALARPAQLVYAVSLLVADGRGGFAEAEVVSASADPSVVQVASTLLAKAGYSTGAMT